ncbi:MAG TPA: glycogen-binding domain-containing protein [Vicinamibacterales bacterium]
MTDRIDRYLEGTLGWTQLAPEERAHADAVEHVVQETRAFVDARPAPDVSSALMREIEHLAVNPATPPSGTFARLVATLWTSRQVSFQFRPAYGLLAAAVVVSAMTLWPSAWRPFGSAPTAPVNGEPQLFVQFRLQASDASNVRLAGSFTNWQPQYELRRTGPGMWTITIPLSPGVHDYAFVVDGERWLPDPYAQAVDDGFGGTNSRIALVPPEDARS